MEMLGLDMDIEADLGIDSIKRVEILSIVEAELQATELTSRIRQMQHNSQ